MIKVHHLNRSRSLRILWLLEEIGQEYEVISHSRNPKTNLAPPELLEIHPLGKSPMIELDGRLITESGAITEILCQRFAPQMIPDPQSDAWITHQELMHFAEGSAMTPILLNLYVGLLGEGGAPLQPRIQSELRNHFAYLEGLVRESGHFLLDQLSAIDIMMIFVTQAAGRIYDPQDYPKLAAFTAAMQARPAFQRAVERGGV